MHNYTQYTQLLSLTIYPYVQNRRRENCSAQSVGYTVCMLELNDWKTILAVASVLTGIISFIPYFSQMLRRKTKPHAYTWLIWTLTFGTAAASIEHGGGGEILAIGLGTQVVLVFLVFLLSLRYGTKNITPGDTAALVVALLAIFVWWGLESPLWGLLLATGIDLVGYLPTYRKSFNEPWSEDLLSWVGYSLAPTLSLLALFEYNLLTVTYSTATLAANLMLLGLLLYRRRFVQKPP